MTDATISKIPEGIPTGVTPVVSSDVLSAGPAAAPTTVVQTPYDLVRGEQPIPQVTTGVETPVVAPAKEGALEILIKKAVKGLAKLFKLERDPITGEKFPVQAKPAEVQAPTSTQPQTFGEKIWAKANQVVEATGKAVQVTTDTVKQATEMVKDIVPPPTTVAAQPTTPTQSLDNLPK